MINRSKFQLLSIITLAFLFWSGCKKSDKINTDPVITTISPLTGTFGSSVTITGSNFNPDLSLDTVWFNGVKANINSANQTAIVVTVPNNAQTGKITVATNGKRLVYPTDFVIQLPVPLISAVSVTNVAYGGSILITGSDFDTDITKSSVKFGDANVQILAASKTQIIGFVYTTTPRAQVTLNTYGRTITWPVSFDLVPYKGTSFPSPEMGYLAADAQKNIYGVMGNTVYKATPSGTVTTFATVGSGTILKGTAVDAAGNVYVTGNNDHQIYKISPTGAVSTFAGSASSGYMDAAGTSAKFLVPVSLTIDASGNLFVCDSARVRKITPAGIVSTFAGSGTSGNLDGQGSAATFSGLLSITSDQDGNVFVINDAGIIRKITTSGLVSTLNLQGPLVGKKEYNRPVFAQGIAGGTQIATDPSGNLYVCNTLGIVFGTMNANAGIAFPVHVIQPSGFVTQFSSNNLVGYRGITSDSSGNIYISQISHANIGPFVSKFSK